MIIKVQPTELQAMVDFIKGVKIAEVPEYIDIKALHTAFKALQVALEERPSGGSNGHQ